MFFKIILTEFIEFAKNIRAENHWHVLFCLFDFFSINLHCQKIQGRIGSKMSERRKASRMARQSLLPMKKKTIVSTITQL